MNKKTLISILLVVLAGGLLSACSLTNTTANNQASVTGEQVDVNTPPADPSVEIGGGVAVPDNFPGELLVGEDALTTMVTGSEAGVSVVYQTTLDAESVFKELLSLESTGWEKESEMLTEGTKLVVVKRDGQRASVAVASVEGKTIVTIVLTQE